METVKIELTVKEVEFVINALAKFPYNEVSGIISTFTTQAQDQLAIKPTEVEKAKEDV